MVNGGEVCEYAVREMPLKIKSKSSVSRLTVMLKILMQDMQYKWS